jgi:hypothetical protein
VPADLTSAAVGDGSWMGHTVTYVQLQNRGPVCTLTGYAEVRTFSAAGRRIPITVQHQTQVTPSRSIRVETVTLPSHGAAQFVITLANRIHGDCSPTHGGRVAVLLPYTRDSAEPVYSWRIDVCDRAAIAITPFFAAAYLPPPE